MVEVAERVPPTEIWAPLPTKENVSPVAKLTAPLSVSVCPPGISTRTLAPTAIVASRATLKPFGKS